MLKNSHFIIRASSRNFIFPIHPTFCGQYIFADTAVDAISYRLKYIRLSYQQSSPVINVRITILSKVPKTPSVHELWQTNFVAEMKMVDETYNLKVFKNCFCTFHNALDSLYSMKIMNFFFEGTGILQCFTASQLRPLLKK